MRRLVATAAAFALAAGWPGAAWACPYCAGSREAGSAYFMTAIGMGLLPIGFGVGLVLWLRRRLRAGAAAPPGAGEESSPENPPGA